MEETLIVIGGIVVIVVGYTLLKRLLSNGIDVAYDAGRKVLFKEQIAETDNLLDVPLVLSTSASPGEFLDALDAIVHPQKTPPGLEVVLYEVSREPLRVTYALGNKLRPQELVTEIRLSEADGATQVVLRVLNATVSEGIFIYKDALKRLREQVEYVAASAGDTEKVAEGAHIYRAADPDAAKPQAWMWRIGAVLVAGALLWLGVGVEIRLLPVWFGVLGAGGALLYFSGKPVAKMQREASAAAQNVLHPEVAEAVAPVEEPPAAVAVESVRSPAAWRPPVLIVVGVLTLVIVGIVGAGVFNGISRAADDSDYPPEDATFDPGDAPADPPDYGGLTLEQLLGYAGEAGEPEYLEVQYLGGGEWYGGNDVLLNFAIVGSDPGDEFMTPLTADIPCFIDSERVSFPEYYAATYESAEKRGMIVIDSYGVLELHVFTQGQAASSDAAGRPPAPGMTSRAPRAILPRSCSSCKTRAAAS